MCGEIRNLLPDLLDGIAVSLGKLLNGLIELLIGLDDGPLKPLELLHKRTNVAQELIGVLHAENLGGFLHHNFPFGKIIQGKTSGFERRRLAT
jgi:hypothetical protein